MCALMPSSRAIETSLTVSASVLLDAGDVTAVALDCGRGDIVVARLESSTDALSSTTIAESCRGSSPSMDASPTAGADGASVGIPMSLCSAG